MSKSDLINQDDYDSEVKAVWSSFINLVLTGLLTIQPVTIDSEGAIQWNVFERCPLSFKSVLENFSFNAELWSNNEKKLVELFAPVDWRNKRVLF